MKKYVITCLLLTLFKSAVFAQCEGIIPNPSFENFSSCPTSFAQLDRLDNWFQGGSGTADYFNCSYTGIPINLFGPATPGATSGTGFVGYNYTGGTGNSNEYVGVCLTTPMTAGITYILDFKVSHGGGITGAAANDPDVAIYGTNNCANLPWTGACPTSGWQLLGTSGTIDLPGNNSWQNGQITFTPSVDINAIAIGGVCGSLQGVAGYYYIDDLELTCPTILPVAITVLSTDCKDGNPMLNWSSVSEQNNDFFTIERSCNGYDFKPIATIKGLGNSDEGQDYSYIDFDNTCLQSVVYYKLSQTDFDGTTVQLKSASIACSKQDAAVWTYDGMLYVDYEGGADMRIYNMQGQVVQENKIDLGVGSVELSIESLAAGQYMVEILSSITGSSVHREKIVHQ